MKERCRVTNVVMGILMMKSIGSDVQGNCSFGLLLSLSRAGTTYTGFLSTRHYPRPS